MVLRLLHRQAQQACGGLAMATLATTLPSQFSATSSLPPGKSRWVSVANSKNGALFSYNAAHRPAPLSPVDGSESEYEEFESSDAEPGDQNIPVQDTVSDIWMPPGNWYDASRYAYAYVLPAVRAVNAAPFIRAAIHSVAPTTQVETMPSSRGAMVLRFSTPDECAEVLRLSPITHDGGTVELLASAETDNRFVREATWVAHLAVSDFPLEHWFEGNIRAAFRGFGTVTEIDPACLSGFDFSSLRFLIEVRDKKDIPAAVVISSPGGQGSIANVAVLNTWERVAQYDARGDYVFFFNPPPPPPPASHRQLSGHGPLFGNTYFPASSSRANFGSSASHNPFAPHRYHAPATVLSVLANINGVSLLHVPRMPPLLTSVASSPPHPVTPPPARASLSAIPASPLLPTVTASPPPISPPPSAAVAPVLPAAVATASPAPRGRRPRPKKPVLLPRRHSARLADKEPEEFVDMTAKAEHLRALKDSLATCSKQLQDHVVKTKFLGKKGKAIAAADLRRLAAATGLNGKDKKTLFQASVPGK